MASLILHPERLEHEAPALALAAVPRGTITERLHVYLDGYPARLHDALVETFPAVAHMIGHGAMTHLTRRYLGALSLESYNLNDAGAELPAFLRADELTTQLPFLADLAELEWDIACAFHAHDESPLDPSVLTSWTLDDWEGARLRFQPSVALVCSPWPIRELWEARETPIEAIALDVHDRPDRVLVYRTGLAECCESVDSAEAAAL
ncbi:MAG: putative DNA-binding domain-containing protein [Deltaproteobacteria bacterium]|nr:putative DNA-binding domain-containing protein [Deltaproteobacteria bacterium]